MAESKTSEIPIRVSIRWLSTVGLNIIANPSTVDTIRTTFENVMRDKSEDNRKRKLEM